MPISLSSFFVSFHFSSFLSVLLFSPFDESAVNEGRLCLHAMSSCENEPLRETSLYFFFFFSCCFAIRRYRARVSSGLCRDRSSLFSSFFFRRCRFCFAGYVGGEMMSLQTGNQGLGCSRSLVVVVSSVITFRGSSRVLREFLPLGRSWQRSICART